MLGDSTWVAVGHGDPTLQLNDNLLTERSKKIKGLDNVFECSVNMDIRIIWYYEDSKIILLLDVGHHDILYEI